MGLSIKTIPDEVEDQDDVLDVTDTVDEMGDLQLEVTKLEAKLAATGTAVKLKEAYVKLATQKEALVLALGQDLDNLDNRVVMGERHVATLGPCAKRREVTDKLAVVNMLTTEELALIMKFTLKDLDDYLTPSQRSQVIEQHQDGPRKFKVEPRK